MHIDQLTTPVVLIPVISIVIFLIAYVVYRDVRSPMRYPQENVHTVVIDVGMLANTRKDPLRGATYSKLVGCLVQDIAAEAFDLPNLRSTGEIGGITERLWGHRNLKRFRDAQKALVQCAARELGQSWELPSANATKLEQVLCEAPREQRVAIVQKFKRRAPYEYGLIRDVLTEEVVRR